MGNTEAYAEHLRAQFGLISVLPSYLHELLRALGESAQQHKPHASRNSEGPTIGKFVQPDPDSWVIGRVPPETNDG